MHQPSSQHRTNRRGDGREARPGADGGAPRLFVEGSANNGQAAGHQKRSSHSLNTPGGNELLNVQGGAARGGCSREDANADQKCKTPSE